MTQQTSGDTVDLARDQRRHVDAILRTTWFDSLTSFLLALVLWLSTLVLVLVVVWLLSGNASETAPWPPEEISWGSAHPHGLQQDFLEPGAEEVVELSEPSMRDSLLAVSDAVSLVAASQPASLVNQPGQHRAASDGDSRPPGPDGTDDVVPRFQRWQLNFTAQNLDSYARQLDHYGIEIGLVGGGIQGVDYAGSLSSARPRVRRGNSSDEHRLYFLWSVEGPLMQFDHQLLQRAFDSTASDISVENRQMLKFIGPELENQLTKLELEYAMERGHSTVDSIAKTVFVSRPHGSGYQFVVLQQRYRTPHD